jgi:hypothetical protein
MSFFGIQIGLLQIALQNADTQIYYCNLTATRIEDVDNMANIDIIIPTYGTG